MKLEYVISMDASSTLINSKEKILKLIELDDDLVYPEPGNLHFANFDGLPFSIEINKLPSSDVRKNYFDVVIETTEQANDEISSKFTKLNRKLIKLFNDTFHHRPKVLWSDLDSYYSTKAYPLIKDLENLMRKVITKLLIVHSGFAWENDNVSQGAKEKVVKNKGRDIESNYLSGLDFIDLTEMIFEKYSSVSAKVIFERIEKANNFEQIEKVKAVMPRSNWDRFINIYIDMEESDLVSKWKEIYEYRCSVAHNANFSKSDYEKCQKLIESIQPILISSLNALNSSADLVSATPDVAPLQTGSEIENDSNISDISKAIEFLASRPENNDEVKLSFWSDLLKSEDFVDQNNVKLVFNENSTRPSSSEGIRLSEHFPHKAKYKSNIKLFLDNKRLIAEITENGVKKKDFLDGDDKEKSDGDN